MKQILLAMLCALAVLTSCKPNNNRENEAITFKRVDLTGAKFITLASSEDAQAVGKAAQETRRLYKIDENGEMTAVVFYVEVDRDGNKSTENAAEDIKVTPYKIIDYGRYMQFYSCKIESLTDKYRRFSSSERYHFLVRKSDGAIFEIDYPNQTSFFPRYDYSSERLVSEKQITYNDRGELYMIGDYSHKNVSKLKVENDKLLLQQLTTGIDAINISVDKDDNLCVNGEYIYSANGSVVAVPHESEGYVLLIDNEYYTYKYTEGRIAQNDYTYTHQLRKITSYAPQLDFKEVATLTTEERGSYGSWDSNHVIKTNSKVIFLAWYGDSYLLYDKLTQKLSMMPLPDEFKKINAWSYNEQGIAYEYAEDRTHITKYNAADMTTTRINCDRSAVHPFIPRETQQTSTDFFEFGIQNSNGAPIRIQTTLETGKVTVHQDADDRIITELIKVN